MTYLSLVSEEEHAAALVPRNIADILLRLYRGEGGPRIPMPDLETARARGYDQVFVVGVVEEDTVNGLLVVVVLGDERLCGPGESAVNGQILNTFFECNHVLPFSFQIYNSVAKLQSYKIHEKCP